jgi:hypothetical protein
MFKVILRKTGDMQTGDMQTGDMQTGNRKTGNRKTDCRKTGRQATGRQATGGSKMNIPDHISESLQTLMSSTCLILFCLLYFLYMVKIELEARARRLSLPTGL